MSWSASVHLPSPTTLEFPTPKEDASYQKLINKGRHRNGRQTQHCIPGTFSPHTNSQQCTFALKSEVSPKMETGHVNKILHFLFFVLVHKQERLSTSSQLCGRGRAESRASAWHTQPVLENRNPSNVSSECGAKTCVE